MGVLKTSSKDEYEGDYKEGFQYEGVSMEVPFMHGVGKLKFEDGSCFLGDFEDNVFHGEG
jgi:hypothetical protein